MYPAAALAWHLLLRRTLVHLIHGATFRQHKIFMIIRTRPYKKIDKCRKYYNIDGTIK